MLPVLFAAYGTVFVAEIVGDKLLYTTGVLATRYRAVPVLCGMAIAFMAKMGVAVLVGEAASKLPPPAAMSGDGSLVISDSNFGQRGKPRVTLIETGFGPKPN